MIIIIPARGGSKRISRKNLQIVGGKTLVRHTLERACDVPGAAVVLSTDDREISNEALGLCVAVYERQYPPDLPEQSMAAVVAEFSKYIVGGALSLGGVLLLAQPSPFYLPFQMDRVIRLSHDLDSKVVSVAENGHRSGLYCSRVPWWDRDEYIPEATWYQALQVPHRSVDINTPEDLEEARKLWKELQEND